MRIQLAKMLMLCLLAGNTSQAQNLPQVTIAASLNRSAMTVAIEQELTKAYQHIGYQLEIQYLPAERSLKMSDQGKFDGELFRIAAITQQYPNLLMVPVPLANIELFAFIKTGRTDELSLWQQNPDLRIGYVRGFKMAEHYEMAGERIVLNTAGQAVQMLQQGKIDILLEDLVSLYEVIDGPEQAAGLTRLPHVLAHQEVFHFVHLKQQQLIEPLTVQLTLQLAGKKRIKSASGNGGDQK